jgi:hypothetical protein
MEVYLAILYIHVIAVLGLVGAMSVEALALLQLRRTSGGASFAYWLDPLPGARPTASICLLILLLSGGYLAGRASLWGSAWPWFAVGIVIAFGGLAGMSSSRLRIFRNGYAQMTSAEITRRLKTSFLNVSLSIRAGLILAAVLLMTAKPGWLGSLIIVVVFVIIFWALAALKPGTQTRPGAADQELDRSAR